MRDGEQPPTTGDGSLRLTYHQIAARLGISGEAARQLVRRRKWPRIKPNRLGAPAIVVVPEDELAGEQWREDRPTTPDNRASPPVVALGDPHTSPDDRLRQSTEINGLITLLTAEHERADRAERRAEAADADRRAAEARAEAAEQARDAERARADSLRDRAERVEERAKTAEGEAEQLRRAEAERKARGRLRRVLTAWRGE
jgi:hypothetical protein